MALAGCPGSESDDRTETESTTGGSPTPSGNATTMPDETPSADWKWENVPEPTVVVDNDGDGDYESFNAAYRASSPGDVIGIGPGSYSLNELQTTSMDPADITYDTVKKDDIAVVGQDRLESKLTFNTDSNVLSVPGWEFWKLTTDTNGSIIGPRDGKHRGNYLKSPIMDPPGYASRGQQGSENGITLSTSGLARSASTETTHYGIAFDRVVNAVEDLGMDHTGSQPIDSQLNDALQTGTLIEFPPGAYLLEESHLIEGLDRVGIRGIGTSRHDVRLVPAQGNAIKPLDSGTGAGRILVENLAFDEREDNETQLSLLLRTSGGTIVKNVEFLGRTPDDDGDRFNYTIGAEVTDVHGLAVFEEVYAGLDAPAKPVEYPNGVEFFWGGPAHNGEVIFRNPVIHRRNSNGVRFTNSSGVVTLLGGEFVNNQNANVRFGAGTHPSKVSSATDTYIRVDEDVVNVSDALRVSGDGDDAGAVFRNIHIEWGDVNGRGVITFPSFDPHGRAEFYDCVVHNVRQDTPTVWAAPVSIDDDSVVFEACAFSGTGGGFIANSRSGSVIRDSCIDMSNASIHGFETEGVSSNNCRRPTNGYLQPAATITVTRKEGQTVDLSATDSTKPDSNISSYRWDIDDTTKSGQTISHSFSLPGTYPVRLTIEDGAGTTATQVRQLIVDYPSLIRNTSE
jgi:hypothetical protein